MTTVQTHQQMQYDGKLQNSYEMDLQVGLFCQLLHRWYGHLK